MKNKIKRILAGMLAVLVFSSSLPTMTFASVADSIAQSSVSDSVSQPDSSIPQENNETDSSAPSDASSDSTSLPTDTNSVPPPPPSSLPDETTSLPSESESSSSASSSTQESLPTEPPSESEIPFAPLSITEMSASFAKEIGETADFFVRLNRDDVAVSYQWQKLPGSPVYDGNGEAVYDYGDGESTRYIFPFAGITEAELLEMNPDAKWQGIEMYLDQLKRKGANAEIKIAPNTPNYILDSEAAAAMNSGIAPESTDPSAWKDIEGATESTYHHTVTAEDENSFFRCVITITDEAYFAAAKADADKKAQADAPPQNTENATNSDSATATDVEASPMLLELTPESADLTEEKAAESDTTEPIAGSEAEQEAPPIEQEISDAERIFLSDSMYIELPETEEAPASKSRMASRAANNTDLTRLSFNYQWIEWVTPNMEYITADSYTKYDCSDAGNAYWTKLNGGRRPDNSQYKYVELTENNKMEVLSAWYGKTVYFRMQGNSGKGKSFDIPAYTSKDYQTGKTSLYKTAVRILNVFVPDSGGSYYASYLKNISDANCYLIDSDGRRVNSECHITTDIMKIEDFNLHPDWALKDAEGNYKYDLVAVGVCTGLEPDISGAAAWALKDYLSEGYGFMIGHDTLYGYGGITNASYVPDKASTTTPYYMGSGTGHFNMNWLMGVNKFYTEASPYQSPSMILNIGNASDKSTLYGDDLSDSHLRVKKILQGNPMSDVLARCPTNYPYISTSANIPFTVGTEFAGTPTHTNQQMAYGDIWFDYATNSLVNKGMGRLVTDTRDGVSGSNNFYLTTNGNFGMNQIGHIKDNQNIAQPTEAYTLANTIMYLSQRQQCQVCQSAQGGSEGVHFVRRIASAEQLTLLRDQTSNWYNYPLNGCYMLTENITLPANWEPIQHFSGHFNADGKSVVSTNGKAIFAQAGTLGQFTNTLQQGWNLGTDKTKGYNLIAGTTGRTTGTSRCVGYLQELFGTNNSAAYYGYTVTVRGTDGGSYSCKVNSDGKYVLSNLPCTGVMAASVYDAQGRDIAEYGLIRVNVPEKFWNTNETTPLYLLGFTAQPVQNTTVYENENALLLGGGINSMTAVSDITWQYRTSGNAPWTNMAGSSFNYSVTPPVFHSAGDASWTETKLTINNCPAAYSGYNFRAVFKQNGRTADTYTAGKTGYMGLLTVRARPAYLKHPVSAVKWLDDTAIFTAGCEYFLSASNSNFTVQWMYRTAATGVWMPVAGSPYFPGSTQTNTVGIGTTNPELAQYLTTTTLRIPLCNPIWNGYQFRAEFKATDTKTTYATSGADLTVKNADLTVSSASSQTLMLASNGMAGGTAAYTARVTYKPGKTDANTPNVTAMWKYSGGKDNYRSFAQYAWNQAAANAEAAKLGTSAPTVTITNSAPVDMGNGQYYIDSTMKISNVSALFDADNTRYYFSCNATTQYSTSLCTATSEKRAALILDYACDVKFNEGVKSADISDGYGQYANWTFPNLTVGAGRPVYTCILRFEDGTYNANDFITTGVGLPGDLKKTVANGHLVMLTSAGGISAASLQTYLRQVVWKSYDKQTTPTSGAKVYAYIDCARNFATRSAMSKSESVSPLASDSLSPFGSISPAGDTAGVLESSTGAFVAAQSDYVAIYSHPQNATVALRGSASFGVNAASGSGLPVQYQWQVSDNGGATWSDLIGEVYSTLTINPVLNIHNGWYYRCVLGTTLAPNCTVSGAAMLAISADKKLVPNESGLPWIPSVTGGGAAWATPDALHVKSYDFSDDGITHMYMDIPLASYTGITFSYTLVAYNGHGLPNAYDGDAHIEINGVSMGNSANGTYTLPLNGGSRITFTAVSTAGAAPVEAEWAVTNVTLHGTGGGAAEDDNLVRSDYSAMDRSIIFTVPQGGGSTGSGTVNITAQSKVYDGTQTNALVTVTGSGGLAQDVIDGILSRARVRYSSGRETLPNAAGSGCVNVGSYTANVTYAPADVSAYGLSGTKSVSFSITPRSINLSSSGNDKIYDKTLNATIKNIVFAPMNADTNSGVITADNGRVMLDNASVDGIYPTFHQTNNLAVPIVRTGALALSGAAAANYVIGTETYTGKIMPRALNVHSKYLDSMDTANNPRNVKVYDGNANAVIKSILVDNVIEGDTVALNATSYAGTYATKNSGETLKSDGTVQSDRLKKLIENNITRTAPISIVNNEYKDYVIGSESYSGAICRSTLGTSVIGMSSIYGRGMTEQPRHIYTYNNGAVGHSSNLLISVLAPGDSISIDESKSHFTYEPITKQTPVGLYPLDYVGLTEANYPVLSNYIVWHTASYIEVTPRTVRFTVNGGYEKEYGEINPPFELKIENHIPGGWNLDGTEMYFPGLGVEGDTLENAFDGKIAFINSCTWQSDVLWANDNRTHLPYPVYGTGLTPKKNINGKYNYDVEWVSGGVTVHPTEITVYAVDKVKEYGMDDPAFEFNLSRPRIKESDLQCKVERMRGEDVGTYRFLTNLFYDPNYIIKHGPDAHLEIQPALLWLNAQSGTKYYGENNPYLEAYYSGFKRGDDERNVMDGHAIVDTPATKYSDVGFYWTAPRGYTMKENSQGKYNYELVINSGFLTILKRPIDVYADNIVKTEGEADPPLTYHLGEGQSVLDPEHWPLYVYLTRIPGETVGERYPIYCSPKEITSGHDTNCCHWLQWDNVNYEITYHPGNLTVKAKDKLVAYVKPNEKIYGEENPTTYELGYTLNGKAVTDLSTLGITGTPVFTTDCTQKSYVGEYTVNVTGIQSTVYPTHLTFAPGTLTVKPRPMTLTCDYVERNYGDPDPVIPFYLKDGITDITYSGKDPAARINPGDLEGNVNWIDEFGDLGQRDANFYYTVPGELDNDPNYVLTNVPEMYRIWNMTLQIGMPEYFKYVGEENPPFEVIITGFENGDTIEDLQGELYFKTTCTKDSPKGNYRITPLGLYSENKYGTLNYNTITTTTFIYVTERPKT